MYVMLCMCSMIKPNARVCLPQLSMAQRTREWNEEGGSGLRIALECMYPSNRDHSKVCWVSTGDTDQQEVIEV